MTGMRPLKFQHAYSWQFQLLWCLLTVLIPWISAFSENDGDKTYNIKIGFDLTRGAQGGPSLRIRDFEETEDAEKFKPSLRADVQPASSSASNENQKSIEKKKENSIDGVEMKAAEDSVQSDESNNDSGGDKKRSTKGMRDDEFVPQAPDRNDQEDFDENSDSANSN